MLIALACAAAGVLAGCVQDPDGQSSIDKLFGIRMHTKLKCEETGEEFEVIKTRRQTQPQELSQPQQLWQLQEEHKCQHMVLMPCCALMAAPQGPAAGQMHGKGKPATRAYHLFHNHYHALSGCDVVLASSARSAHHKDK